MFRIAISLVQGLRGKSEAIQYWIQSIRALQPQNITCSQQNIFSIYKPYHRSSTSLYSSLVGVSVSLQFFLTSTFHCQMNSTPFYIHLHQFTISFIPVVFVVWRWLLPKKYLLFGGVFIMEFRSVAPLDSTALTSSTTWCVGERSSSSSPSDSWRGELGVFSGG